MGHDPAQRLFAILTGDLVGSSRYSASERTEVLQHLETTLSRMRQFYAFRMPPPRAPPTVDYYFFRGDSLQVYLPFPKKGLEAALFIRTSLLSADLANRADARIAVGIGRISYFAEQLERMDGEAFRLSGAALEQLDRTQRHLIVRTPWKDANAELSVECALLDELMERWTGRQAAAVFHRITEGNQARAAEMLGITQPAISQQLRAAGFSAVQEFLDRFESLIPEYCVEEPLEKAE
ncbi:MAG: hypothetical protein QMD46_09700 [Methanomicrobiales archaeon]|nr:hypothetical protein [Methanomicrobiales archaeon]